MPQYLGRLESSAQVKRDYQVVGSSPTCGTNGWQTLLHTKASLLLLKQSGVCSDLLECDNCSR